MPKPLTVWITRNCGKFWKRWEYQSTWPASWETYMQVRKQLDTEQQTGSKGCCSMSSSNCCFLTCILVFSRGRSGALVFPSLSEVSTVYCDPHNQRFGIVNKAEIDVFLELSCFFNDPADVGNLISGFSVFSKSSLNIWKFTVHILLKPGLENFEHYFTSMWDEYNCAVVRTFFGIVLLWDWNENWPFSVLWPLLSFPNFLAYWVQHFHSIIF